MEAIIFRKVINVQFTHIIQSKFVSYNERVLWYLIKNEGRKKGWKEGKKEINNISDKT